MRVLSGSVLKLIALITMIIDHTTAYLLSETAFGDAVFFSVGSHTLTWCEFLRMIGRTAFPIYCYLITEGFQYTHDRKKYGLNLLIFALISEIPWNLIHSGALLYKKQNVFFTLFLGYCVLCFYEKYRDERKKLLFGLTGIFLLSILLNADYGCKGVGVILVLYLFREQQILQAFFGCCFLKASWQAIPAFTLLGLYNGKRGFIKGKAFKYIFYAIYPVHMLILYVIRIKTVGF